MVQRSPGHPGLLQGSRLVSACADITHLSRARLANGECTTRTREREIEENGIAPEMRRAIDQNTCCNLELDACTISSPASPSCFDPALPTHTTLQFPAKAPSSKISSTISPRRRFTFPRSLKPSLEASSTRQGTLFCRLARLRTTLAGPRAARRSERRFVTA